MQWPLIVAEVLSVSLTVLYTFHEYTCRYLLLHNILDKVYVGFPVPGYWYWRDNVIGGSVILSFASELLDEENMRCDYHQ